MTIETRKTNSQQEIVGFVLIVVIVVIIGLFLLVYYLREPVEEYKSPNVENFLRASMLYTTECSISIEPLNIEYLTKSCYKNEKCLNEKMACEVLNDTLSTLLHESWLVSSEKPVNAYSLIVYYVETDKETLEEVNRQDILELKEGNCTGSKAGAERLISSSPGNIVVNLEICYT